ncbi:Tlg2-vesicle protein [Myotisia sp. PD_48]|nr:Tlg2-vesicle protein [Myotisia sp. PD_48]
MAANRTPSPPTRASSVGLLSDPDDSISPSFKPIRPPWTRSRTSLGSNRRGFPVFSLPSTVATMGARDRALNRMERTYKILSESWSKMTILQKLGTITAWIGLTAFGVGFLIFTGRVFAWLGPIASDWENSVLAYFIVWVCIIIVSFPPLVGWSTFGTICGFIFGIWKGWLIYAFGTVVGSTLSFILSRTILSKLVHRLLRNDTRFAALSLTLKYDGLKLLCMIRLCPLPYSICNGAISTFPTVTPLKYGLATAIISPKLLVAAFIGSRLRILSQNNEKMSGGSKAINIVSIVITICIGIFTGWYIYRRTMARAKELEAEERANLHGGPQANAEASPGFTDDPNRLAPSSILARDEEEAVGFGDEFVLDADDDNIALDPHYRDEFTDNESDVFADGDGDGMEETYYLHNRADSK